MKVKDFKNGVKIAFYTLLYGLPISLFLLPIGIIFLLEQLKINDNDPTMSMLIAISPFVGAFITVLLSIIGFVVNYTPLKVKEGEVSIPANDQIRTFLDILTVNPITGLYRRKKYNTKDIQGVANGYTRPGRGKKGKSWNVVITGIKNGQSFSQKIDVSNKQVRDEVRNLLKQTISGKVSNEFSY